MQCDQRIQKSRQGSEKEANPVLWTPTKCWCMSYFTLISQPLQFVCKYVHAVSANVFMNRSLIYLGVMRNHAHVHSCAHYYDQFNNDLFLRNGLRKRVPLHNTNIQNTETENIALETRMCTVSWFSPYIDTYIHKHTHTHTYIHTYTYIHTCMHAYIHTYIHIYINT